MQESGKDIQDYTDAFQRGEEQGFSFFFNSLFPALCYYAFRIINDRQAAEDVVAESFIKIWERHESFNHPRVIQSWLYTTVRNGSINILQQNQSRLAREQKFARDQPVNDQVSFLDDMIIVEVTREIHNAIDSLPTSCRVIFQMMYIQGKMVREIAEELQLSISTIKNQKARGLTILRKKFPELSTVSSIRLFILVCLLELGLSPN